MIEHKKITNFKNDRSRDQILKKFRRKIAVNLVVKKALAIWRNISSESEKSEQYENDSVVGLRDYNDVFDNLFAFMKKSNDEVEEEITLLDLKKIWIFILRRSWKTLACVLTDSLCEWTAEKNFLNNSIDISQDEKTIFAFQMSYLEEENFALETEKFIFWNC